MVQICKLIGTGQPPANLQQVLHWDARNAQTSPLSPPTQALPWHPR